MILQEYMHEKEVSEGNDDWLKEKQEREEAEKENENTEVSEEDNSVTESEKKED